MVFSSLLHWHTEECVVCVAGPSSVSSVSYLSHWSSGLSVLQLKSALGCALVVCQHAPNFTCMFLILKTRRLPTIAGGFYLSFLHSFSLSRLPFLLLVSLQRACLFSPQAFPLAGISSVVSSFSEFLCADLVMFQTSAVTCSGLRCWRANKFYRLIQECLLRFHNNPSKQVCVFIMKHM